MRDVCVVLCASYGAPRFSKVMDCGTTKHPPKLYVFENKMYIRDNWDAHTELWPKFYTYTEIEPSSFPAETPPKP